MRHDGSNTDIRLRRTHQRCQGDYHSGGSPGLREVANPRDVPPDTPTFWRSSMGFGFSSRSGQQIGRVLCAWIALALAGCSTPEPVTDAKVRLMAATLRAREQGDLIAAQKAVNELAVLAPTDIGVARLRQDIDTQI